MVIWIIKIGEPLKFDYENVRLLRSSILANGLVEKSYKVYFFVDKFDHFNKRYRDESLYHLTKINYFFLKGIKYKKNFSVQRFINHFQVAINFYQLAKKISIKPDFVIISFPTIYLSFMAALFCKRSKVPYVIDLRDSWPMIFSNNRYIKSLLHLYYKPYLNYVFKNAYHITGCAPFFENFIKLYTKENKLFTYIPHTFPEFRNVDLNESTYYGNYIVYFGAISKQRRLDDFLSKFIEFDFNMKFYICGVGDHLQYLKSKYKQSNIIWLGQVDIKTMSDLASNAKFGIAPYELHEGYIDNIPNKIVEYLSYGLPVITNINNTIIQFLNENDKIIFQYKDNSDILKLLSLKYNSKLKRTIKNIFHENFSETKFIEKFENIINSKSI